MSKAESDKRVKHNCLHS